jgi:membrane fusion protein (multidrug efflux system)
MDRVTPSTKRKWSRPETWLPPSLGALIGRRSLSLHTLLFVGGAIAIFAGACIYGHEWWTTERFIVSTDDAYVQADYVIISPKVSGYLSDVPVQDNQHIKSGAILARIDDRDYQTALASAQANLDAAAANIDDLAQRIAQQSYAVAEARAAVDGDQAALMFAEQDAQRYALLSRNGASTEQNAQSATSSVQERRAARDRDNAAVGSAQAQLGVLSAQLTQARAALAQRQAALHQAALNLSYTTITSPIDGTIGERTLRVGQYVQAGTQLMAVVPLKAVYVTANYKETQLTHVRAGQPVSIDVDTFPGATVDGVVNSIAPASGEEFSLLPPDNATGNFTKIVQRIPVKIAIDPHDPLLGQLRPGMSVESGIDTRRKEP